MMIPHFWIDTLFPASTIVSFCALFAVASFSFFLVRLNPINPLRRIVQVLFKLLDIAHVQPPFILVEFPEPPFAPVHVFALVSLPMVEKRVLKVIFSASVASGWKGFPGADTLM
jgi:hypothetical protein